MTASIPRIESAINLSVNVMLACHCIWIWSYFRNIYSYVVFITTRRGMIPSPSDFLI